MDWRLSRTGESISSIEILDNQSGYFSKHVTSAMRAHRTTKMNLSPEVMNIILIDHKPIYSTKSSLFDLIKMKDLLSNRMEHWLNSPILGKTIFQLQLLNV